MTDERMHPVYNNVTTPGATTYINIGDGGNREGKSVMMNSLISIIGPCPEWFNIPSWSAYRESAFGHGRLEVFNSTHMGWTWHKVVFHYVNPLLICDVRLESPSLRLGMRCTWSRTRTSGTVSRLVWPPFQWIEPLFRSCWNKHLFV